MTRIKDANLNKAQREDVLKNWKALHEFVEQHCHLSIPEFASALPSDYKVEEVGTADEQFKFVNFKKMPYRYCVYENPMLNRLILQADLLVYNDKSQQWEYCDYTGL